MKTPMIGTRVVPAPPAAPSRMQTGSAAVPPIRLELAEFRLTASVPGRTLACAVRTLWGWQIGHHGPGRRHEWVAYDSRDEATSAVYGLAMRRLHGN